jgi:hypothetical protein
VTASMSQVMARTADLEVHEVPDGYIIYHVSRDRVHYLNNTAAIIFEFCDGKLANNEIAARVAQAFELGAGVHAEIESGLEQLIREGLIQSSSK